MELINTNVPQRIAVIGSGAAGLTATHLLQQKHHVTLFEASNRIGGHTNTITLDDIQDNGLKIDTGFIVMNHRNYPLLTKLFKSLDVPLQDSNMSFGYHDITSGLQYCGSGISGLFSQRKNIFNPRFHHLIKEVFRFFSIANSDAESGIDPKEKLGSYLEKNNFTGDFINHHIIPMGSAIWSTPCEKMMDFPAYNFINFFKNHGLLGVKNRPQWRTVTGGSSTYINLMKKQWNNVSIILKANIDYIERTDGIIKINRGGNIELFDHVIIATHANQALDLLVDPNEFEKDFLSLWNYSRSKTYLHTDETVMPPIRRVWSSWNFQRINENRTSLTYYMNSLQNLPSKTNYFVSLDPPQTPKNILYEIDYEHPIFTFSTISKRKEIQSINGQRNTWFAGAYFGNGFHEDAVRSSVEIAEKFGVTL